MTEVMGKIGHWARWMTALAMLGSVAAAQAPAVGAPRPGETLYLRLGNVGLSPQRVYQVRDAHLDRPGIHLTLEDGTIGFTEDVLGHVTGAFFEGQGEVLVVPPDRAERASLALFTDQAILEEKFFSAYVRFNDETYEELRPYLRSTDGAPAFLAKWSAPAAKLAGGDALRLLVTYAKLLPAAEAPPEKSSTPRSDRMLHARIQGARLGVFDLFYDSLATEQVQILQLTEAQGNNYYDIWMSFNPRQPSNSSLPGADSYAQAVEVSGYKIRARVTPPRRIEAEATLDVHVLDGGQRTFLFELSRHLEITRVETEGKAVEFIHNPSISGSQLERQGNDQVAVLFPRTLQSGDRIELKFFYGGDVLAEEANGLLSVGARGMWYPNLGLRMSDFDLQFSYPTEWTLLATGERRSVDENPAFKPNLASGERQSHWVPVRPIPVAGFNLGRYTKATSREGNVIVEAYAAEDMERAFPQTQPNLNPSRPPNVPFASMSGTSPSPARNVQAVADRAAEALSFFASSFGEYPYGSLALTQSPGPASQGWPGLVFLSSYAFLSDDELAARNLRPAAAILARQTPAHETAHQWWGDLISWKSYRDQWISEGLASYCALLQLEAKDPAAFQTVMESYRDDLMQEKDGRPMWEAGPVTLGQRLNSSRFPGAYEVIAYGRGAWLFHMLRQMLADAQSQTNGHAATTQQGDLFLKILRHVQEKYAGRSISTRELLQEFAVLWPETLWFEGKPSLDWFWDGWVQGISIPYLELTNVKILHSSQGTWVTGTILQRDAPEDLVTSVPIYAQGTGKNPKLLGRVFADGPKTRFRWMVPSGTRAILLDPQHTVLRRR